MAHRLLMARLVVSFFVIGTSPAPGRADNAMGYRLFSAQEASQLPRNHGSLGMDVERAQEITDGGMTFDIIHIKQVRRGSPGALSGFQAGDQIIAIDGRVFPTLVVFAAYIGSIAPGTQASVDYIPAGTGPAQAERITMTTGSSASPAQQGQTPSPGLSTGTKVAIGVGAAALLGCYELGCFSHHRPQSAAVPNQPLRQNSP